MEKKTEETKHPSDHMQGSPDMEESKKAVNDLAIRAAGLVKKYPLQAMACGLAAGFLLGRITKKKD